MQNRYCFYCGDKLSRRTATTDHVTPRSKGGKDDDSNIVDCCKTCNRDKGSLSFSEFRIVLAYRMGVVKCPSKFKFHGERDKVIAEPMVVKKKLKPPLEISLEMKKEPE